MDKKKLRLTSTDWKMRAQAFRKQRNLAKFEIWLIGRVEKEKQPKSICYRYSGLTERIPSEIKNIIIQKLSEKWIVKQLSSTFKLNNVVWRAII